jgi:uncharacterized protein
VTYLLDVNCLIALIDPTRVNHDAAHDWFAQEAKNAWATCPLTENGVIRIVGHARYPNSPGSPTIVANTMRQLLSVPGHEFWPDDISLLNQGHVDLTRLTSQHVTDCYLLALAVAHRGQLATFDRRMVSAIVDGGHSALCLI